MQDHEDEEPRILARLRAGDRIEHYETVRLHKDGRLIDISLTVSPIKGPNGQIVGASKIARDITERKQARKELDEASERLRLALEATKKHAPKRRKQYGERTSLPAGWESSRLKEFRHHFPRAQNSTERYSRLEARQTPGPTLARDSAKALDTIERNARAQAQLVDDLLDVSRIITGGAHGRTPVGSKFIYRRCGRRCRPCRSQRACALRKVLDTGHFDSRRSGATATSGLEPALECDQIRRAVVVFKFVPGESIHLEIVVSDTGQGISRLSAARFRSFLTGRSENQPATWWHGTGTGNRPSFGRDARRNGQRE